MRKSILISSLVMLLALPTFSGCKSKESSSNQITSSSNNEVLSKYARLEKMLENLRKSVKLSGKVEQEVTFFNW